VKVLVTGANGFLGRATVEAFLEHGHEVRALVRPATETEARWSGPVEIVRADLRAGADLEPMVSEVDAVVHLAAGTSGDEMDMFAATVVGTERLLTAMARTATRRLVLASSFTVYDWDAVPRLLTESSPLATDLERRGGYTAAKVWQERVARRMSSEHGFSLTVLRPGVVWGPGNEYPPGIAQKLGPLHVVFGRAARLPLTYVENCAECFVRAAERPQSADETVNVVDDAGTSTSLFLKEHLRRSGEGGVVVSVPYRLAEGLVGTVSSASQMLFEGQGNLPSILVPARFAARFKPLDYSNAKAREVLGWAPRYSFDEALDRTYGDREDWVPSTV
jgi:nucleoside-diphosphate-sugar epimerase